MHVILGFLGTIVTILWLLHRLAEMGVTLGGLNPFLWRRRRKWRKHYEANPIYKISSPLEVTALLMTAVAKADGDMSAEEKHGILSLFGKEFHLPEKDAAALLTASSHLLGKGEEVRDNLKAVLTPSLENFTAEQAHSAVQIIDRVARIAGAPSDSQTRLISNVTALLNQLSVPRGKWQ